MIRLLVVTLSLSLVGSAHAADQIAHLGLPPDAGISDDDLTQLGPAADAELVKRFAAPENEKFRKGLLMRMRLYGDLKRPNAKAFTQLKDFVESEVSTCEGEVSTERIFNIGSALEVAGQRGGQPAVEYLKRWITDDSVYGRVRCFNHARNAEDSQDQLRRSALTGLGQSGSKSALDFLASVARNPPKVKYIGSFMGVLNTAVAENKAIQKDGMENHFQADRENIKANRNRKRAPEDVKRK